MKKTKTLYLVCILFVLGSCHSTSWQKTNTYELELSAPESIQRVFELEKDNTLYLKAMSPAYNYKYDVGEKDAFYGKDSLGFRFNTVSIQLHEKMPRSKVMVDLKFIDGKGNMVSINDIDLLRFIPNYDAEGDMIYPEILLEEFNRFGYTFRKEHKEFAITLAGQSNILEKEAAERAYRCQVVNNCLAATKFEFSLISEDYSDFDKRVKYDQNLNQNKILSHSWFYLDKRLYTELVKLKNPRIKEEWINIPYDSLSNLSETVEVNFKSLRNPIKYRLKTEVEEFGYKSGREIEPLDNEQFYKKAFQLVLSDTTKNYTSILEEDIQTTQFKNEGFYSEVTPKVFNLEWMKYLDSIHLDVVNVKGTESYVQITITGAYSPYEVTIGNVDLALVDEQKLMGYLFGFNTYPKNRRYNPVQSTIAYDADLLPEELKPYVLLTDKKTGKWVNNQYKGIEKIYLTYESLEGDYLMLYVLSYERIIPVWMAKIKLPATSREQVRIRKGLYNY